MTQAVIAAAVRTALGGFGGSFKSVPPAKLAEHVMQEAVKRAGVEFSAIDKVIFGNCFSPLDQNIARIAAYHAGVPEEVAAFTINATCGSSMQAIISSAQSVLCGESGMVLAGGVESMSAAPYIMETVRWGQRMKHAQASDLLWKGMQEYPIGVGMGLTAENLAEKYGISREEQDQFALQSHHKAAKALREGAFKSEIAPFPLPQRKGDPVFFAEDEHVRPEITLQQLAKLPAAFKAGGTVTAGNACGMNDASAAMVITSASRAADLGLTPLFSLRAYKVVGVDPNIMGIGPVPSIRGALKAAGLELADIDRFEINEAFAAQYLACEKELGLDREKVNVNGGGIALGHPVGATGCRVVVTLLHNMLADDLNLGVASLCAGGGMGFSVVLERLK